MNMLLKSTFIALISVFSIDSVMAQSTPAQVCSDKRTAGEIVEESINKWKSSPGGQALIARRDNQELLIYFSDPTSVVASASSAMFGKSREAAVTKSFLNTQAKFIKERSSQISATMMAEFMNFTPSQNDLKLPDPADQDRVVRIGDKIFKLSEAMLDNALRKEGVNDDDIKKIEPSKKIDTFRDKLTRTTTTRAFAEVAGIFPARNFEAIDCAGRSAVATISVFSSRNLEFAKDVVLKRPVVADPARKENKSLEAQVEAEISSKDILHEMLLRKSFDQNGYPSLVSYGQWSFATTGNDPRERERKMMAAKKQAESNANAQIAFFLKGTAETSSSTMASEIDEKSLTVTKDGTTEESLTDWTEKQVEKIAAKANVQVTGLRVIGSWSMDYPTLPGIVIVGVVVGWSPQFADIVNAVSGSKVRQSVTNAPTPGEPATNNIPVQVYESKAKNNASDF